MKLTLQSKTAKRDFRCPQPAQLPNISTLDLSAQYRWARVGGDFFDFVELPGGKLLILVLDIAGKREEALDVAAGVQETFRKRGPELFNNPDVNSADATAALLLEVNQAILNAAKGIRCAPAFLGCYDCGMGFLSYINAGHVPALLKDGKDVSVLGASGMPLGLFSHAPHDAGMSCLSEGSVLIVASRGLLETASGNQEFGLERLQSVVADLNDGTAEQLCLQVLQSVKDFVDSGKKSWLWPVKKNGPIGDDEAPGKNDVTVVALVRLPLKASAQLPPVSVLSDL